MLSAPNKPISAMLIIALISMATMPLTGFSGYTPGEVVSAPISPVHYAVPTSLDGQAARKLVTGIVNSPEEIILFRDAIQAMAKVSNRSMESLTREETIELLKKYQKTEAASKTGDMVNLRGHVAEEIAKRDLAAAGYKVEFTKPGSLSSDLHYTNGQGKIFGQVKVCSSARASMDGSLKDAIAFRATGKPEVLKFEGLIPTDQFKQLVQDGILTKEGLVADPATHSPRLFKMCQTEAAAEANAATNAGRYAMIKNEAQIQKAISSMRFRAISMSQESLTTYTETLISKSSSWLQNLLKTESGTEAQSLLAANTIEGVAASAAKTGTTAGNAEASMAKSAASEGAQRATASKAATNMKLVGVGFGVALTVGIAAYEFDATERAYLSGKISAEERARQHGRTATSASIGLTGVGLMTVVAFTPVAGVAVLVVMVVADYLISPLVGDYFAEQERIEQARLTDLHLLRLTALNEFILSPEQYAATGQPPSACAAYRALYAKNTGKSIKNAIFIEPNTLALHSAAEAVKEATRQETIR